MCIYCRPDEAKEIASQMIGHQLHTKQTGTIGRPCTKVYYIRTCYVDTNVCEHVSINVPSVGASTKDMYNMFCINKPYVQYINH